MIDIEVSYPSFAEAAHEFIGCLDSDIEDLSLDTPRRRTDEDSWLNETT